MASEERGSSRKRYGLVAKRKGVTRLDAAMAITGIDLKGSPDPGGYGKTPLRESQKMREEGETVPDIPVQGSNAF